MLKMLIFVELNNKTYRFTNLKDLQNKIKDIKKLISLQMAIFIDNECYELSLLSATYFISFGKLPEKYKIDDRDKIIIEKTNYQKLKEKLEKLKKNIFQKYSEDIPQYNIKKEI